MSVSKALDLELKKAFVELQGKMAETGKKIHAIDMEIGILNLILQREDITHRKVSTLPPGSKTYESVGRMFLLTDLDEIKTDLKHKISLLTNRISELENNKEYLENNLKESQDNIREMVNLRKQHREQSDTDFPF